jgi:ABC-type branched-subunit amino acid transport system permease subunit
MEAPVRPPPPGSGERRAAVRAWLAAALFGAALFGAQAVLEAALNPYILQILVYIGINITLAVSLNLINGYTGQFSLGHAGFMALGAYASAALTFYQGRRRMFGAVPGAQTSSSCSRSSRAWSRPRGAARGSPAPGRLPRDRDAGLGRSSAW